MKQETKDQVNEAKSLGGAVVDSKTAQSVMVSNTEAAAIIVGIPTHDYTEAGAVSRSSESRSPVHGRAARQVHARALGLDSG